MVEKLARLNSLTLFYHYHSPSNNNSTDILNLTLMRFNRFSHALLVPITFLRYKQCLVNSYISSHNSSSSSSILPGAVKVKNPRYSTWKTRRRPMCTSNELLSSPTSPKLSVPVRHYCFLIHGWLGNNEEMSYIEHAIKRSIAKIATLSEETEVLVYKPMSNHEKTSDGIAMGGKRVAQETLDYIRETSEKDVGEVIKTISFVGNSLGGLYSRYAITELEASKSVSIDLHFNIFYTTATPHLGVSSHTYIPLPRLIERWAAGPFMGATGKHLFRAEYEDNIINQMSLSSKFLTPLSHFKSRVAYANSFGSDFQVPTQTAAFLHDKSAIPHYVVDDFQKNDEFIVSVYTDTTYDESATNRPKKFTDELLQMSQSLDSLGWRKVFVDVRHLSPISHIPIPFSRRSSKQIFEDSLSQRKLRTSSGLDSDDDKEDENSNGVTKTIFKSNELAQLLSSGDSISIPMGHTIMIANSKSEIYKKINAGGRIVMDSLADDFVHELLKWKL